MGVRRGGQGGAIAPPWILQHFVSQLTILTFYKIPIFLLTIYICITSFSLFFVAYSMFLGLLNTNPKLSNKKNFRKYEKPLKKTQNKSQFCFCFWLITCKVSFNAKSDLVLK